MDRSIGHYRIVEKLGEGGMGVVYSARDERLDRLVALKMIHETFEDPRAQERLWREARAAASVNHPNVCQVYDVGEEDGEIFIAMEYLNGESLAARLQRGPIPLAEAVQVTLGILSALGALHRRSIIHRDLKPSNVFLTPHGVKLLDFGLAIPLEASALAADVRLTQTGTVVGTPRYMSPEQLQGETAGPPSDLFAAGALLFEMLTGKPAFGGENALQVYHAVLYETPPALAGGPCVVAADRVIQNALAKKPALRYASAEEMARDARAVLSFAETGESPRVLAVTRLLVLPFRVLRSDPETDFLGFSLPDAIVSSLSGLDSLVVRSSHAAAKYAGVSPDFQKMATEAEVDAILLGTLLRSGDQVRVSAQLVEAPTGTLLWTKTVQGALVDLFQIQDDLSRQIVESVSAPLSARNRSADRASIPKSPKAYELYLRANELAYSPSRIREVRDLYRAALAEDPNYAPAWARLGRALRVIGKYGSDDAAEHIRLAGEAFRKAFSLDPDLSIAHNLYTYFEIEELGQARTAMLRLLARAGSRSADPELYAGLVVALRFCGLLDASLAADRRARRLDPTIRTSVAYTHYLRCDWPAAASADVTGTRYLEWIARAMTGRTDEAIREFRKHETLLEPGIERDMATMSRSSLEGNREECVAAFGRIRNSSFRDPEGLVELGRLLAQCGAIDLALLVLDRAAGGGFSCDTFLAGDPWLDPLRASPEFRHILRRAESGRREAAEAYTRAGGERLLGVPAR